MSFTGLISAIVLGFLALSPAGAQVAVTSPTNGATLTTPVTDVVVSFSSGNGNGKLIDFLELRTDNQTLRTFDLPAGTTAGTHTFAAVDLSALGSPVTLVVRAFVGKKDKKFVDSPPIQITIGVDADAPVLSALSPVNGSATANPRPTLSAQVGDTGGSGVDPASIVLQFDGAAVARIVTPVNANTVNVTFTPAADLADGTHSFTVRASDLAGNGAAPASSSFLIDRTPPTLAILAPANGSVLATATPALSAQAADTGSGLNLSSLVLRLDGTSVAATVSPTGLVTFTPASPLAPGAHTVTFDGRDAVGNIGATATSSFTLILGAPTIAISTPLTGSFSNNQRPPLSALVTAAGSAGIDFTSIVVKLDNVAVVPNLSSVDPTVVNVSFTPPSPLAPGPHTYTIDARNLANVAASTASSTFTLDLGLPTIAITAPNAGVLLSTRRPTITATITDVGGSGFVPAGILLILNGVTIPANQLQITLTSGNLTALLSFTPGFDLADGNQIVALQAVDRAGNAAPSASRQFAIDSVPPAISIVAPTGTSGTSSVPLNATVSDLFTGVPVSSIQVTLNGGPATVTLTPGPLTSFGAPASVVITGTLTAQTGMNLLLISAADVAGNPSSVSRLFDAGTEPPPPFGDIVLTIVSGDGQQGLAGRGAEQPLVVRASNTATGGPVPGLPLVFTGGQNTGTFSRAVGTTSTLTDGGGIASVRYAYSTRPGANVVRVYVSGLPETAPVEFNLTGQLPSIGSGPAPSACNFGVSTADFPGSALARLLTVKVTKSGGQPVPGELVRPFVSTFRGEEPPLTKAGKFMPAKSFTDSNGEAKFAFVVDDGAPPGDFTMRFGLPEFRQLDGTEVHLDIEGRVRDPNTEFRNDPVIDSGQGQISPFGKDTSKPLRAKTERRGGFIVFKVIEGNGVFSATPNSDVRDASLTDCLKPIWLLAADNNGFAELNFRRTTDVALIEISQGSDVFAVGPPEVYFASPNQAEIPNIIPVEVDRASPTTSFKVMVKVPKGETPDVDLRSINSLGEETPTIPDAVAAPVLGNAVLAFQLVGATAEYDTYASREIVDTSQLNLPGETATPGGGFVFLETTDFGGAVAALTVQGEERKFTVRNSTFVKATQEDLRPLIFNKRSPIAGGALQKIRVSFKLGDIKALDNVHWTLPGGIAKDNKNPEIFLTFDAQSDGNHEGTEGDPIVIGIPEDKDNMRSNSPVKADLKFKDKDGKDAAYTLETVVRVAQTERRPQGATDPGAKSQAGLTAIANWGSGAGGAPPQGTNGQGFTFADVTTAPQFITDGIPQGVNLNAFRLSYVDGIPRANGASFRDDLTFQIYGSVIVGSLWIYPKEVLSAVIDHEAAHLRSAFDAQTVNTPYKALSTALQATFAKREALDPYLVAFDHARMELDDLLDPRITYRYNNDRNLGQSSGGGPGGEVIFIQAFNGIEQALLENKEYTFVGTGLVGGVRSMPGVALGATLLSALKTRAQNDYKRAVYAFPELKSRSEFEESGQLLRPPQ